MKDRVIDTGVAPKSTPTQAENGVAAKISELLATDAKAVIEQYLNDVTAEAGITKEEFLLLNEIARAWADQKRSCPATDVELASDLAAYRKKVGQVETAPVETIRAALRKAFRVPDMKDWVCKHLAITRHLVHEPDHEGKLVAIPRYDVRAWNQYGFLQELEDVKEGELKRTANGEWLTESEAKRRQKIIEQIAQREKADAEHPHPPLWLDKEFAALTFEGRIQLFGRDELKENILHWSRYHEMCIEEAMLMYDITEALSFTNYSTATELAERVNVGRAKKPGVHGGSRILVTPAEVSLLLERLFKSRSGSESYCFNNQIIVRTLIELSDMNGQKVQMPAYRNEGPWVDDVEEMLIVDMMDDIKLGKAVKTGSGRWLDRVTGEYWFQEE